MSAALLTSIHSLSQAVEALEAKVHDLQQQRQPAATPGAQGAAAVEPAPAALDPLVLKRVSDLEATAASLRDGVRALTEDVRLARAAIAQDRGLIEATLTAKLEQSLGRMLRERIATASDDVLSRARAHAAEAVAQQQASLAQADLLRFAQFEAELQRIAALQAGPQQPEAEAEPVVLAAEEEQQQLPVAPEADEVALLSELKSADDLLLELDLDLPQQQSSQQAGKARSGGATKRKGGK